MPQRRDSSSLGSQPLDALMGDLEEILEAVQGSNRPAPRAAALALRRAHAIDCEIQRRVALVAVPPPPPLFLASGGAAFRPAGAGRVAIEGPDGGRTTVARTDLAEYMRSSHGRTST
jgi:hypothetical protein